MIEKTNIPSGIALGSDEKLLLVCSPSFVYILYAWAMKVWALVVTVCVLLFMLNMEGVRNLIGVSPRIEQLKSLGVIIFVLLLLLLLFGMWVINRCYHFYFTDRCCIYDYQFLSRDQKTVPYSRIFNMEVRQSMMQNLLQIADVYLNTQNMSSPDLSASYFPVLFGLSKSNADKINEIIGNRVPRS